MLLFISNSNPGEYGFLKLWESFILDRMGNVENHCIKNIDIVKDYWLVKFIEVGLTVANTKYKI